MTPPEGWLHRLDAPQVHPAASRPVVVDRVVELLGPGPARWAVALGHQMATEIIDEIPAFGGTDEAFETLRMGTESSCQHALISLATGDVRAALATEESLEGDRDFVRRGIRLDMVLRGIRLGHARMATELLGAAATLLPDGERVAEMERISHLLFAYIDLFASSMAEEYRAEHDRWITSAAAERAELVRDLIDGRPVTVDEASLRLGYQLDRHHVAMVLWQPGHEHSPIDLQRAASRLVEAHGCSASLEIPHGTSSLWLWASWRSREVIPADVQVTLPATIQVTTGTVAHGAGGFRQSHLEATSVAEIIRGADVGDTGALTRYEDVELAVLLAQDIERARTFVLRELGPAAAATPAAADLRDTLTAYLASERSLARAGEQLHVARNTVAYRVRRFQEHTGRDLRHRRLELEAALRLVAVLGDRVLEG